MSMFPVLSVTDYQKSLKFYTETLGFTLDMSQPMGPENRMFGILNFNGQSTALALSEDPNAKDVGTGLTLMIYPDNFDIDAHYAKIKASGVPIEYDLITEFWGDRHYIIRDPDGYRLDFAKTIETLSPEQAMERMKAQEGG